MSEQDIPRIVQRGIDRRDHDLLWVWQWADRVEREEVDAWLVSTNHLLAMQPGTPEYRFKEIVGEYIKREL